MTPQEKATEYWRIHGESKHGNAWGPGRCYKHIKERRLRQVNKVELHKCTTNPDHEGIFFDRALRFWDINYW
jgi:hypothetical protein